MNSIKSANRIGVVLALSIALGMMIATSATAQAQNDRSNRWSRAHLTRYAYALGYNRGYDDASQGSYHTYREIQRWREGTEGWEDPMGTRTVFRDNFRRGFARGFMDARNSRSRRFTQSDVDRIRAEFNEGRTHRRP